MAKQVLADSGRMTVAATMKNPLLQQIRNAFIHRVLGFPFARHAMAERLSEVFFGYPHSPLNSGSARGLNGPAPGERFAREAFGAGDAPRFALLAAESPAARDFMEKHSAVMDRALRTPPDEKGIWLIRPDGYVAAVSHAGEWSAIEEGLRKGLGKTR